MLLHLHHYQFQFIPKTLDSPSPNPPNPKPYKLKVRNSSKTTTTTTTTNNGSINTKLVGRTAIQRIAEKLRSLGFIEEEKKEEQKRSGNGNGNGSGSAGEIFLPSSEELENRRVGYTLDSSWSTPHNPVPKPGSGTAIARLDELRRGVEEERRAAAAAGKEERVPSLAELTVPKAELRRLRRVGIGEKRRLIVGKAGITEGIVNGIHERWRRSEVVKIRCEDLCRWNMKRTHDLLEKKTGGLVVWRSGSIIILYRGANYKYPYFLANPNMTDSASDSSSDVGLPLKSRTDSVIGIAKDISLDCIDDVNSSPSPINGMHSSAPSCPINGNAQLSLVRGVGMPNKVRFQLPGEAKLVEEVDHLLNGLGPRFTDWWGDEPVPVDADLLPAVVPGYRRPFRLLPYGIRPKLTNDEMTTLKRLSRHLPYQFALGRNRNLQGLAASMVKLWEKCEIAKIVVKRGVQNMNSKMMAEELKLLTGGTLIARAGQFIVFYRGKDFLPPSVSATMEEQRKSRLRIENVQTTNRSSNLDRNPELAPKTKEPPSVELAVQTSDRERRKLESTEVKLRSTSRNVRSINNKLSVALEKKVEAEKLLAELEETVQAQKPEVDREGITKEERYMLKRVGLRMKPYLPMGRRGVFDGTIENMHLHWKYRELVKVISNARCIEDACKTARVLEAESGGILVAVERARKGYAIIIYRGKNYMRPVDLRPRTLLNKKQALKRSIEAQRSESLKLHILKLAKNIESLKLQAVENVMETKSPFSSDCESLNTDSKTFEGSTSLNYSHPQISEDSTESSNGQEVEGATEKKSVLSSDCERLDTESETFDDSTLLNYSYQQTNENRTESSDDQEEFADRYSSDSTILYSNPWLDDSSRKQGGIQPIRRIGAYSQSNKPPGTEYKYSSFTIPEEDALVAEPICKQDFDLDMTGDDCLRSGKEALSEPNLRITHSYSFPDEVENEALGASSDFPTNVMVQIASDNSIESSVESGKDEFKPLDQRDEMQNDSAVMKKPVALSNKDRLLLRRQALKMKKRPVLAVGKSNLITGVAKTIKTHFEKHPLAIVNVKGRAKGTSIQELVFKLEKETNSVLVSQEPNKVILYRGWGATEETCAKKNRRNVRRPLSGRDDGTIEVVSPQLIEAIRRECGLDSIHDKELDL
ncbi:hypothetical protein Sjap_023693 [Stephania japonica]|uniref:CRM domain-containing protein n=1 Tax=Stephania japonica TaxID=461633 RepID=A0AAP0EC28_9MAGN